MNDKDMKKNGSKKNEVQKSASNFAIAGAQDEVVHRYGAAVKEHLVSYSGVDHETGQILKKSLDSISREKISVLCTRFSDRVGSSGGTIMNPPSVQRQGA